MLNWPKNTGFGYDTYHMDDTDPLGVFLVKSGSKGDRLLFRYPFPGPDDSQHNTKYKQAFVKGGKESFCTSDLVKNIEWDDPGLFSFDDKVLSNLFAVKPELCGQQFELKIENVRFVGHPTYLRYATMRETSTLTMFHVVFALKASASHSVVNSYHDLSHRLSIAIEHEECRCGYLTSQVKLMQAAHDEVASFPEDSEESPYNLILTKSQLSQNLKAVYEDLRNSGMVHLRISSWVEVSFCLPWKVHRLHDEQLNIGPESIQNSLKALRPYHGMLLLVDVNELLSGLPEDTPPALVRLIRVSSPLKNLQQLAADADLILSHVFKLVGHLVFWCKAIVIYPLCDSNYYMISPKASTSINSRLVELFSEKFHPMNLLAVLSQFSLPTSLSILAHPMDLPYQQTQQVQMVIWMLQHRLLIQLHTYVSFLPSEYSPSALSASNAHSEESLLSSSLSANHSKSGSEEDLSLREQDLLSELTPLERSSVLKESACSSNNDDVKNFLRLCPYFKGHHHLEEIMYCENIRRSQLLALLDKFRKILITYQYEDPAVAAFYNYV